MGSFPFVMTSFPTVFCGTCASNFHCEHLNFLRTRKHLDRWMKYLFCDNLRIFSGYLVTVHKSTLRDFGDI